MASLEAGADEIGSRLRLRRAFTQTVAEGLFEELGQGELEPRQQVAARQVLVARQDGTEFAEL